MSAHIDEWYRGLAVRLEGVGGEVPGFPSAAVALMAELWRVARGSAGAEQSSLSDRDKTTRALEVDRDVARADAKALATLNQELSRHRASAEKSLADARALLARREAALEKERSRSAELSLSLASIRLERELTRGRSKRPKAPAARRLVPTHRSTVRHIRAASKKAPRKYSSVNREKSKESRSPNARTRSRARKRPSPTGK